MAKIICFISKARGTGKTLLTVMTAIAAYKFAQQKILVVDTMADQTATQLLQKKIPALATATGLDLLTMTTTDFQQQAGQLQASYDFIFLDAPTADGLTLADQVILLTAADTFALRSAQRLQASITPTKFSGIIQTAIFDRIDVVQPSKDIAPQNLFSLPLANLGGFTDEHRRSGIDIDDEDDEFAWAYFAEVFNELTERSAFIAANGSLSGFTYTPKYVDDTGITAVGYGLTL